jgi:hypothetical protein
MNCRKPIRPRWGGRSTTTNKRHAAKAGRVLFPLRKSRHKLHHSRQLAFSSAHAPVAGRCRAVISIDATNRCTGKPDPWSQAFWHFLSACPLPSLLFLCPVCTNLGLEVQSMFGNFLPHLHKLYGAHPQTWPTWPLLRQRKSCPVDTSLTSTRPPTTVYSRSIIDGIATVLPPGVTKEDFEKALVRMKEAIGKAWVFERNSRNMLTRMRSGKGAMRGLCPVQRPGKSSARIASTLLASSDFLGAAPRPSGRFRPC